MLEILAIVPLITALLCFLSKSRRLMEITTVLGSGALLVVAAWFAYRVYGSGPIYEGSLFMDAFSAYILMLVCIVGFIAAVYSVGYIGHEYEAKEYGLARLRYYYSLFHIFIFTMVLVSVSNNLGIMWIAIEATTLASAFLVAFYNKDTSLEAAWKYIIICSVGITLALLGIILAYASSVHVLGESSTGLDWSTLMAAAKSLDPTLVRVAFIMVLVGYGTKVGLAPMHTWLPDAHSQAPTPISALLSGVLLNCAMYGVLRFHMISSEALGPGFSGTLLLLFGVLSLLVAAAFIILAKDYKRLLAYSSIEHMGIISIGFGLGGYFGIFGGLLHMLNHALTKSMLFFSTGNILLKFKSKLMEDVRGLGKVMPITAIVFFAGALAITGSPPFSVFLSEITILYAGVSQGQFLVVGLLLLFLTIIFGAMVYHVGRMVFGEPSPEVQKGEVTRTGVVVLLVLLAAILITGLIVPDFLANLLNQITALFPGGGA